MVWNIIPATTNQLSKMVQLHLTVNDYPEEGFPVLDANRHKICPRVGVIKIFDTC